MERWLASRARGSLMAGLSSLANGRLPTRGSEMPLRYSWYALTIKYNQDYFVQHIILMHYMSGHSMHSASILPAAS